MEKQAHPSFVSITIISLLELSLDTEICVEMIKESEIQAGSFHEFQSFTSAHFNSDAEFR